MKKLYKNNNDFSCDMIDALRVDGANYRKIIYFLWKMRSGIYEQAAYQNRDLIMLDFPSKKIKR